jgi:hypothetical protein
VGGLHPASRRDQPLSQPAGPRRPLQDEQGRGWEFNESGEARWPDQKFVYELSLNDPGAGCEYMQTEDLKEGADNKRFGYAWKNGKLSIYPAHMANKKVRCESRPIAVLTPQ